MKILAVLLVCLALAAARPARPKMHFRRDALSQFFNIEPFIKHQLRDVVPGGSDCVELADTVGEIIHTGLYGLAVAPEMAQGLSNVDFDMVTTLVTRVYGFDMINDVEARRNFYCEIAKSQSISDLKNRLDSLDMNFNMFRLIYDYAIATLKMSMPLMEMYLPEQAVDDLETLHSLGLFDLDPEGVALVEEFMSQIMGRPVPQIPASPSSASPEQQCLVLQEIEHRQIAMLPRSVKAQVRQWTGIDLDNADQVNTILCAILEADDLRGVYDVYDEAGVIENLYQNGYPVLAQYALMAKQQLEYLIDMLEGMSQYNYGGYPSNSIGGPQGGPPGSYNYGGPPGGPPTNYGGQYGGQYGGPPPATSPQVNPFQNLDVIKLALKFLQKLEDMGLLSLT